MTATSQFIIALGIIFVLIWVAFGFALTFADWKQYEEVDEEKPAAHGDQPAEHRNDQGSASGAPHDEAEAKRRKRQKAYRESQARLINVAAGLNVLTAIAAIAGFGALYLLYGTLVETKNAVTAASTQAAAAATQAAEAIRTNNQSVAEFKLSERPWVDITEVRAKGPLVFDSAKSAHIDVEVTTVNGGRSAAVNEGSDLDLVMSVGNVAVDRQNRNYCEPVVAPDVVVAHVWAQSIAVLLPNVPYPSEWPRLHTTDEPITAPTKDGQYGIYIAACFGYSDQFGAPVTDRRLWVFVTTNDQQLFLPQGSIQGHFERAATSAP